MAEDPHFPRFISYISIFTFFIVVLVSADNFLLIFLGWEGIGLSSYLLINFWFTRIQANKAGIKAILVNRVGDFGLILGILLIYISIETVEYASIFALAPSLNGHYFSFGGYYLNTLNIIGFLLFVGACGKSAQLGLHTWLPDAIEGPTPVSALIHAATLVTGGVYLLARCSPLLEYAPIALAIITVIGGTTAVFAGTVGLIQNDIKRVIAYSTCSQLGYIIFSCGCSQYNLGVYHLANHAFFKALLFLAAGSLIHGIANEQDIRKIGGLRNILPFTYSIILIGSFSLIGIPFLSGFYSKENILGNAYALYTDAAHFAYHCGSFAAFCTGFYSLRVLYLGFLTKPNGYRPILISAKESSLFINLSLCLLALPSIFFGYLFKELFAGLGSPAWANAIFTHPNNITDIEFLCVCTKSYPLILGVYGGLISFYFYTNIKEDIYFLKTSPQGNRIYNFLNRKWFFDKLYNNYISQVLIEVSYNLTYKTLDKGILETLGPRNLSKILNSCVNYVFKLSKTGSLYGLIVLILSNTALLIALLGFSKMNLAETLVLFALVLFIVNQDD